MFVMKKRPSKAASSTEYALLSAMIVAATAAALMSTGNTTADKFGAITVARGGSTAPDGWLDHSFPLTLEEGSETGCFEGTTGADVLLSGDAAAYTCYRTNGGADDFQMPDGDRTVYINGDILWYETVRLAFGEGNHAVVHSAGTTTGVAEISTGTGTNTFDLRRTFSSVTAPNSHNRIAMAGGENTLLLGDGDDAVTIDPLNWGNNFLLLDSDISFGGGSNKLVVTEQALDSFRDATAWAHDDIFNFPDPTDHYAADTSHLRVSGLKLGQDEFTMGPSGNIDFSWPQSTENGRFITLNGNLGFY